MAILVVSRRGDGFPIAYRLQESGEDVTAFVVSRSHAGLFDGMLKSRLSTAMGFQHWIGSVDPASTTVLFDSWFPAREMESEEDSGTDGEPSGLIKDFSSALRGGSGKLSDWFRARGFRVIGASGTTDRIESSLERGRICAETVGASLPRHVRLEHGPRAASTAEKKLAAWTQSDRVTLVPVQKEAFEPFVEDHAGSLRAAIDRGLCTELESCDAWITESIEGPSWSESAWWSGSEFSHRTATLDLPDGGSVTWARGHSTTNFDALADSLRQAGYIGPVSALYRIDGRIGPVWQGWRFGLSRSDSIAFFVRILRAPISRFLAEIRGGVEDGAFCVSLPVRLAGGARAGLPVLDLAPGFFARDVREGPRGCETAGLDPEFGLATGLDDSPRLAFLRAIDARDRTRVVGSLELRADREALETAWKTIRDFRLHV